MLITSEEFSQEKINTLNLFIKSQKKSIEANHLWYHPFYLKGFKQLFENGFCADHFRNTLKDIGWKIIFVEGYLTGFEYFSYLNKQILPVIYNIRPQAQIHFAEFPDMIHDIMGHSPMLLSPSYTCLLKQLSDIICNLEMEELDKKYLSLHEYTIEERNQKLKEIHEVETELRTKPTLFYKINNIALWTIEFGILGSQAPYQSYGAAIVGSPLEIKNIKEDKIPILNLGALSSSTLFNFEGFQDYLYTSNSFDDVITYITKLQEAGLKTV